MRVCKSNAKKEILKDAKIILLIVYCNELAGVQSRIEKQKLIGQPSCNTLGTDFCISSHSKKSGISFFSITA